MSGAPLDGHADGRTSGQDAGRVHLSISDAAARLETTPRNVRRWIAEGRLDAEPDPNSRGRVVSLESVRALEVERDAEKNATRTSGRTDKGTSAAVRPSVHAEKETPSNGGGEEKGELVEQLRGEVEFLRARNAELNAIVMQQARALSAFGVGREVAALDQAPAPEKARETGEEQPEKPEPSEPPAPPSERAKGAVPGKSEPRPLWMVVLGIRPKGTNR